eukprot:390200-Amorphochlora_amoeboformis.AAC.1
MRVLVLLALCVSLCVADLYMHSPPGSNNRNRERKDNRNNGNRLTYLVELVVLTLIFSIILQFDSQNNGKGGYAV